MPATDTIRILLVTDSSDDSETITSALSAWERPVTITVVRSLAHARYQLAGTLPDLVMVDLLLPDGHGFDLLPREREGTVVPILILASQGDEKEAVRARRAGALDYLVKSPAMPAELPHAVERALREWDHIRQRRKAEETLRRSERNYRLLFENMTAGFALHEMIYDNEGNPSDYRFLEVNPAFERLTGLKSEVLIGRTVREIMPQTEQYWIETFGAVARTGEPSAYVNYSKELGRYYDTWVFSPEKDRFAVVFTDVTDKMRSEEALRRSEERWRSVFNTAAAGMVIISPTGTLMEVNPWMCSLLGYTEEEMVGRTVEEITHPDDRETSSLHYDTIFKGERSALHHEKRYLCKDGRVIWGHASVACVVDDRQQPVYCIGLVQDITERVEMEEGLRKANRELDAFVHTVSHDLRTPLTAITGYADVVQELSRERLDEQAKNYLDEICRQGNGMMELLEDLLALAQVGRLERPTEPVDMQEVVEGVIMGHGFQLMAADMQVETGNLPATRIPKSLLSQIFDNLIGNAIRYAGPGGVIEVAGERKADVVRLWVRDHGPGIPEEERCRIFDLFYRASSTKEIKGTGIGLATVQKIAHIYGGQTWVEETPGGGSTFLVEMMDEHHCEVTGQSPHHAG